MILIKQIRIEQENWENMKKNLKNSKEEKTITAFMNEAVREKLEREEKN
jgi:hypothetical protein